MKNIYKIVLVIICSIILPSIIYAQEFTYGTNDAPIDGGLTLLIAAGVGAKKIKSFKKEK